MPIALSEKQMKLAESLKCFGRLAVALSGGVDSAVLLAEARAILGDRVIALTARSPLHPGREVADAAAIAGFLGVAHTIVDTGEMGRADLLANTPRRCYICKHVIFGELAALAAAKGFPSLAHGANADDLNDYRPGLQAARELGVAAPLMDAGLTKAEIRSLAKAKGLTVWDKPAMACLATRIPYGTPIRLDIIERIEKAERILESTGFTGGRVRWHRDVARIEVPLAQLPNMTASPVRQQVVDALRKLGFRHIALDLEGYVAGSLNRSIE
jgi:uncharacterized protein